MSRRVVLLHGFTGSAEAWDGSLLASLSSRGLDPHPIDLPGHGRLTGSRDPVTLDGALSLVDEVVGEAPTSLMGYSMGGRIALHFTLRDPERVSRLVLESASPGLATAPERRGRVASDAELARRIVANGIEAFVDEWEARPLFATRQGLPTGLLAAERERRLRNDPHSLAAALAGLGTGRLPSLWSRLAELRASTLLIAGERDRKFVEIAERMADRIPDARLVVVPGVGHTVHLEAPAVWCDAVGDFLTA